MTAQSQPQVTLFGVGPGFGLPETSPYVMKTMVQLAMAGIDYRFAPGDREASPKGQLPYIEDAGDRVADSTFIRGHIEARYGVDLDAGLTPAERAQAWAFERMIENQLGWAIAWFRFMDPANFAKGPAHWFDRAPEAMREDLRQGLKDAVATNLKAVGIGRHAPDEIALLGTRSLWALSSQLGDKPFLMGQTPTSVDAIAFGVLATALTPFFDSPLRRRAEGFANLVAYVERMMARYFPDFAWAGAAEEAVAA
ncbi:glutathione S-transferase family protein [Phenylobacterium aquaticum]|uniref:glutathione S-transferase family protein n=1 Tax=Phenylobacterium aquaticum TaxID=1763816 RepID=UPI0026F23A16|nr:glutathione S-transferase family protein [Phenylobacterium aquaticum]